MSFKTILLVACSNLLILPSNAQIQKGTDIYGESDGDQSGLSVSMPDANTIAIGSPFNDGHGEDAGQVRIYSWVGNEWVQKGLNIVGTEAHIALGFSISMPDSNTIAIGAPFRKYAYDIWGDTVNTAARMESSSDKGRINISGVTHELLQGKYNCIYRGKIEAKNKGEIDMYYVEP